LTDWVAAIIERWRFVVGVVGLAVAATGAVLLFRAKRYEASLTLSTVTSPRSLPLGGAGSIAASFLNLSGTGGLQSTPVLIIRLARLQSVTLSVAAHPVPGDSRPVIERLTGDAAVQLSNRTIIRRMNRVLSASFDRESGLVTLRAVHRDSALARAVIEATVSELQRAFVQASRAQASELRKAQEVRLDSASNQLRNAEDRISEFVSANRVIAAYSPLQARLQRLQRAVDIAQTVYLQVRTEREAAIGKELDETPAVVVLDSLPAVLPDTAPKTIPIMIAAIVVALVVAVVLVVALEWARGPRGDAMSSRDRFIQATRALPIIGQWAANFLSASGR
jgi:uncharacterized protein involved in exopolysaccharide biosynthesis